MYNVNKKQLLLMLSSQLTVLIPIFLGMTFLADYLSGNISYIFQSICVLLATIPWVFYIYFKKYPTIKSMMLAMDVISACAYIIILIGIFRFTSVMPEYKELYTFKNAIIISICILIPFSYGLYYGYKRWSVFFRIVTKETTYYEKNMTVFNIMDFLTNHPDSSSFTKNYWLYGIIANLFPVFKFIIGGPIIWSISASLLISILPIHIGSIIYRRILFHKYVGKNVVTVS